MPKTNPTVLPFKMQKQNATDMAKKKNAESSTYNSINDARARGLASLSGAALASQTKAASRKNKRDDSDVPF